MSDDVHVLILGTADWNQPIATNQHYMTRELADLPEADVSFVESLALRTPELNVRDIRRIARRLSRVVTRRGEDQSGRPLPENVKVVSPLVAPASWKLAWPGNRLSLQRAVNSWRLSTGTKVLWTYTPLTYGLESDSDVTVYHCVDLLGEFPGVSRSLVEGQERRLARSGAIARASSPVVQAHLQRQGFQDTQLWPNVADTDALGSGQQSQLDAARNGRAVFAGNLTTKKVNFDLLEELVERGVELHLAGPISQGGGDASTRVAQLQRKGAAYHGHLDLQALGQLYRQCAVGLIPYELNPYTRGVSPLKTYEYLWCGAAVVSTAVPALSPVPPDVMVAKNSKEFVNVALDLAREVTSADDLTRRGDLAARHSWSSRGEAARQLLLDQVAF